MNFLVIPIMVLNFVAGILGGIWLAFLGQWGGYSRRICIDDGRRISGFNFIVAVDDLYDGAPVSK